VCQFYGGDVDARENLAEELPLPAERAEGCAEEFDLAYDSWDSIFTELLDAGGGTTLLSQGDATTLTERLIFNEVAALNTLISLPAPLIVTVEAYDEANTFYDLDAATITTCTKLENHLREIIRE
jgi:hypothetical protein